MKITLTKLHFGGIMAHHPDGRTAYFVGRPGGEGTRWARVLTGARDRWGNNRVLSAYDLAGYLRVRAAWYVMAAPGGTKQVPDDKGIFDRITADDILRHSKEAHGIMPTSIATLGKAARGEATKVRKK